MPEEKNGPKPVAKPKPKPVVTSKPATSGGLVLPGDEGFVSPVAAAVPEIKPFGPKITPAGQGFREEPTGKSTRQGDASINGRLKDASVKAQTLFTQSVKAPSRDELEAREQELESLTGKDLNPDTLLQLTGGFNKTVLIGGQAINNGDDLVGALNDPNKRAQFYQENKDALARTFRISSEKDLETKLQGGITELEKIEMGNQMNSNIYDPLFRRRVMGANEPGFKPEFGVFAPDPVASKYDVYKKEKIDSSYPDYILNNILIFKDWII
jgi:hypothetical protein